jgi:ABC-type nickel/cobalt efflux system permease component RcnA
MIFKTVQTSQNSAQTCFVGPRLFTNSRRRAADLQNRSALLLVLTLGLVIIAPRAVAAHPMGNFSISHFAGFRIEAGAIDIRYILDMAEIPTFQEMQMTGIVPAPDDPRVSAYLASKAEALKGGLAVSLNGRPLALTTESKSVIFPPGAGNLPTMKIGVVYRALLSGLACPCTLDYRDDNFPDRAGWKEVVAAAGPGATLTMSTADGVSRSQDLANYPTDLINSPPQDLSAQMTFVFDEVLAADGKSSASDSLGPTVDAGAVMSKRGNAMSLAARAQAGKPAGKRDSFTGANSAATNGAPAATPVAATAPRLTLEANKQGTPRNSFTDLIASNHWGLWFLLTAALIAAALGGLHALEPGHGKTIVAAYLVGSQGTAAHALLLGMIVTATHTAGVYALGLITLYASRYIVPDHLYPLLGIASGLTIAFLGLYMLRRRLAGHDHEHHHHHGPWGNSHDHGHPHEHPHVHADGGNEHLHVHTPEHRGDHAHSHTHEHPHDQPEESGHSHRGEHPFSYRQLVTLGVTGGIVPCPAALVVLLSAISLHRVAFGLYLIVAFSLGLAAVLISIGLVTVYARRLLARLPTDGPLINRWLPTASAAAITCLGVGIAAQALLAMGLVHLQL